MDDPEGVKLGFLLGAAAGAVVVAWLWVSRPDEVQVPSAAFDSGQVAADGEINQNPSLFDSRRSSPTPLIGDAAGAAPAAGEASETSPPRGTDELARLGAPADDAGWRGLGEKKGPLSRLLAAAARHPAALRLLLNNKTLVDAYFSRDLVRRNCSSAEELKNYLMDGASPGGVSEEISMARSYLSSPSVAAGFLGAAADTEFARRLTSCPSIRGLAAEPAAAAQIAAANPALLGLVVDPATAAAAAGNPQAAAALAAVKAAAAGAAAAP